jgi:16S rRNA (uracil1498-N3)-methyltransferase
MRYYVSALRRGVVELDEDESRHARKVMRAAVGDEVELFDGAGSEGTGHITALAGRVQVQVTGLRATERPRPHIEIATALPKGDRAAMLVEKISELGADRLVVLHTQRSVVEPGEGKMERLRRIALESGKQSGRTWLMEVEGPVELESFVHQAREGVKLIADTAVQADLPRREVSWTGSDRIVVLIGPEGGWTDHERLAAAEAGFTGWRLGPHVLRVETAAIAAVAILRGEPTIIQGRDHVQR